MPTYVTTFRVKPNQRMVFSFPIDMLRYDRCHPKGEDDSVLITGTFWRQRVSRTAAEEAEAADFSISIMKVGTSKTWRPRAARWESFGWEVIEESIKTEKVA